MNKQNYRWIKHIDFLILDLICIQVAFFISYYIRHLSVEFIKMDIYKESSMIITMSQICLSLVQNSYHGILRRGYLEEFKSVLKNNLMLIIILIFYLFMVKSTADISRVALGLFGVWSIIIMYIFRICWKMVIIKDVSHEHKIRGVLIVSTSDKIEEIIRNIKKQKLYDTKLLGCVLLDKDIKDCEKLYELPVVADKDMLLEYVRRHWVDEIFFSVENKDLLRESILEECVLMGIQIQVNIPKVMDDAYKQYVGKFAGYNVLISGVSDLTPLYVFEKRLIDIIGGTIGSIITLLMMIVVAPCIYFSDKGPIIFSQERIGKNGRRFKIFKFRTMYEDAEQRKKDLLEKNEMNGLMFKMQDDPRIIGSGKNGKRKGIGHFLRKYSIDEFPQFFNILKGDMSLVGTRPPTVDEWERYDKHHRARMAVKPGLTGLWQVSGRSDMKDFEDVVRLDMEYIEKCGISMDIKILFKTVIVVLTGNGAE